MTLERVAVVRVYLGEDLQPEAVCLRGELVDEGEGLRREEARRARRLHRVADGVQPHQGDAALREAAEHAQRVELEREQREALAGIGLETYELPMLGEGLDLAGLYRLAAALRTHLGADRAQGAA